MSCAPEHTWESNALISAITKALLAVPVLGLLDRLFMKPWGESLGVRVSRRGPRFNGLLPVRSSVVLAIVLVWIGGPILSAGEGDTHEAPYASGCCFKLGLLCVQKELGLTPAESKAFEALRKESDAEVWADVKRFPPPNVFELPVEEGIRKTREYNKIHGPRRRKLHAQFTARCAKLLDTGRLKRLKQISWQQQPGFALRDPELADALGLSKEQRTRLSSIDANFKDDEAHLFAYSKFQPDSPDLRNRQERLYPAWERALLSVLSKPQQSKRVKLLGKPFDFSLIDPEIPGKLKQIQDDHDRETAAAAPGTSAAPEAAPKRAPAVPAKATLPSEENCRQWARSFEIAFNKGDVARCNELIDWDALAEKATAWPSPSPAVAQFRTQFLANLKSSVRSASGIVGPLIQSVGVQFGGSYKFLRCRTVDGRPRALFRMLGFDRAHNYHEYSLGVSADGAVRAVDFRGYLSGEIISENYRQWFLPFARQAEKGRFEQLAPADREFVANRSQFFAFSRETDNRRIVEIYSRLPESMKKMRLVLSLRLRAAQSLGNAEWLRAIDDFLRYYPNEPTNDLVLLDVFILRKSYDQALAAIDRLDKLVGGDPYLKVRRADLLLGQGKPDEAWKVTEAAIAEEPTQNWAYLSLADQSIKNRNFAKTAELLTTMVSKLHMSPGFAMFDPSYAEFRKSNEYKAWLETYGRDQARGRKEPGTQ
jgi:hypothetical protein